MRNAKFAIRNIALGLILLALTVQAIQGGQTLEFDMSRLSDKGREAYSRLQSATMFRLGPVGFTGETSPEELALQSLLSEGDAVESLRSLCRSGTAAGSLYGLMGLRKRDAKVFEEELRLYRARLEQIEKSSQPPSSEQIEKSPKPVSSEQIEKSPRSFPNMQAGPGTILTQQGCLIIPEQQESILRKLEWGIYVVGFGGQPRTLGPPK